MKTYQGARTWAGTNVTVNAKPLRFRLDLRNHSPNGFEWGYGGSGPAQLALAILADHFGNDDEALNLHQRFKWSVVAELPRNGWTLTSEEIEQAIRNIHEQELAGGVT